MFLEIWGSLVFTWLHWSNTVSHMCCDHDETLFHNGKVVLKYINWLLVHCSIRVLCLSEPAMLTPVEEVNIPHLICSLVCFFPMMTFFCCVPKTWKGCFDSREVYTQVPEMCMSGLRPRVYHCADQCLWVTKQSVHSLPQLEWACTVPARATVLNPGYRHGRDIHLLTDVYLTWLPSVAICPLLAF